MVVLVRAVVSLLAIALLPGCCLMLGNTNTARAPEKGTSEVGLTFGATSYQFEVEVPDEDDPSQTEEETFEVTYPVVWPEIPFAVAVTDDVSIGGRVAPQSLGLEGHVKWRFLHADRMHMAIAPAVNHQAWLLVQGFGARLPLLVTYDITDNFSFTTVFNSGYTKWNFSDEDFEPDEEDDTNQAVWNGEIISFGLGAGVEIRGESFFLRPAFEFTRYQTNLNEDFEETFQPFNSVAFMLNIGFVIGRTKKQLDRIEKKIDALQPQPQPAPAPPPTPPPNPQEQAGATPDRRWWVATTPGALDP